MIRLQALRWLIVGLTTNGLLYLVYLALTRSLLSPKAAMTFVYVAGAVSGFIGHKNWSFRHKGRADLALIRYLGAYAIGYSVNWTGLEIGVSVFELSHEIVQAVMILVVALLMFVVHKYFVFGESESVIKTKSGGSA